MSDRTGMDEEDKDADPLTITLDHLQDPLRSQMSLFPSGAACELSMEQDPMTYMNTFDRHQSSPSKQGSNVLDVLSTTDMLSEGPLVNGPSSHQALESVDLQSLSTEKEEEKSITQLKTVQNIDTTGIWGFDVESSESSLDNYDGTNDLSWDPQREFMQFLWDNHDDSPVEEETGVASPPASQRRRKRKMDMVVMVDPSEEPYSDLTLKSTGDMSDEVDRVDPVPTKNIVQVPRKHLDPQSLTGNKAQYPNGTANCTQLKDSTPARNQQDNSRLSLLAGDLSSSSSSSSSSDSCSEEEPSFFPCTKCSVHFKQKNHLQRHMRTHPEPPGQSSTPRPFICRECGQSFRVSKMLIRHMSTHEERRERLIEEIKGMNDLKDEGRNARLQCPQCSFGTNCANTFIQHAKTHEKDKWYYDCEKCSFLAASVPELERHMKKEHCGVKTQVQQKKLHCVDKTQQQQGKRSIFRAGKDDTAFPFSCNMCSYSTTSKNVFKNHLGLRHNKTFEEYQALRNREKEKSSSEQRTQSCRSPLVDSISSAPTSKFSIQNQFPGEKVDVPHEPNDISHLFKKDRIVGRDRADLKSQPTESKLIKSINNLLSRQKRRDETQQEEKPDDVITGLSFCRDVNGDKDDSGGTLTAPRDHLKSSSNGHKHLSDLKLDTSPSNPGYAASRNHTDISGHIFEQKVIKKYPSKRKMSTPYRNAVDQDSCFIISKYGASPKRQNIVEETDDSDEKEALHLSKCKTNAGSKFLDKTEIKQEKADMSCPTLEIGSHSQQRLVVKEECIEAQVFRETFESSSVLYDDPFTDDPLSALDLETKTCPYCPAVFESGVGLSNHVRGHLYRVGLTYNARHVVPPEQVSSQDKRPRIRRRMAAIRRFKKAFRLETPPPESQCTHSCPLCGDSFDNKTGQSNHIRGHLKRLGKSLTTKNKTPLCHLRELIRDKKEFQRALQIIGRKRRRPSRLKGLSKEVSVDGLTPSSLEIPKRDSVPNHYDDVVKPVVPTFSSSPEVSAKRQAETKVEVKGSLSSALIGILKKRKCPEESKWKSAQNTAKNPPAGSSNHVHSTGPRATTTLPNSTSEKGEFNRKVCVHCNASFHSGVSLSNHLRAYAKRKNAALLEGTTYNCKLRRQRSRPGSKKKTYAVPHTPEEMYRLTCRFCDLVFQGPLSVQEDWIKHLQRHIMNASVPHTGACMVEVTSLPKDPPSPTTSQQNLPAPSHTAP